MCKTNLINLINSLCLNTCCIKYLAIFGTQMSQNDNSYLPTLLHSVAWFIPCLDEIQILTIGSRKLPDASFCTSSFLFNLCFFSNFIFPVRKKNNNSFLLLLTFYKTCREWVKGSWKINNIQKRKIPTFQFCYIGY